MTVNNMFFLGAVKNFHSYFVVLECGKWATFQCPRGYLIRILEAYYGRKTKYVCRRKDRYTQTKCQTKDAFSKVQLKCNGLETCKMNVDKIGDPCWGPEYFEATYDCIKGKFRILISC